MAGSSTSTSTTTGSITLYKNFEPALINFDPPALNKNKGKVVYLSYGPAQARIFLQTPKLSAPFGVSTFVDEKTGQVVESVDLSFKGMDTDPTVKLFHDKMMSLNETILSKGVKESAQWLGKAMSRDVISEFYRSVVKEPKDPKYSPTMKVKVSPMAPPEVYNENREKVGLDYVDKGSTVRAIIALRSVWFVNKTFGVTWQLVQLAVIDRPQVFKTFSFLPEDESAVLDDIEEGMDEF